MPVSNTIETVSIDSLLLDPRNPRLGRTRVETGLTQEQVLEQMQEWSLDELAVSFVENGFWPQEALIVISDDTDPSRYVVVEGNRRLAALKLLKKASDGDPVSPKWAEIAENDIPTNLFEAIPVLRADGRDDVQAFLGFRHVTGIKEWKPAEKAEYIAGLIDQGYGYDRVHRIIGSNTPTVRRHYIAFNTLRQIEQLEDESIDPSLVEKRFSVLFLALREKGIQDFLGVDLTADVDDARQPVPPDYLDRLAAFVGWVFGTTSFDPLFTDSRQITRFSKALENEEAREYLLTSRKPTLVGALSRSGVDVDEIREQITTATDALEQALSVIHLYVDEEEVQSAVSRFARGVASLANHFPSIRDLITTQDSQDD